MGATILKFSKNRMLSEEEGTISAMPEMSDPDIPKTKDDTTPIQIPTEDLYPSILDSSKNIGTAFQLLDEGLRYIKEAIDLYKENDFISSDDAIQRFQALLPELFCCRNIGDGFGAIINSVYHAITSMNGFPLDKNLLLALSQIVSRVRTEPFIGFDEAVDEIMKLEDVGFKVEPEYYKHITELADEKSFC